MSPALPIGGDVFDVKSGYTHREVVVAQSNGEQGRRVYAWSSATLDTSLLVVYVSSTRVCSTHARTSRSSSCHISIPTCPPGR